MEMNELLEFISEQDTKLTAVNSTARPSERILALMVKLTEETGELADEVLASQGDQRKEKLSEMSTDGLENEVADVIITVLLLAAALNVDVSAALQKKIEKIRKRTYEHGR